MSTKAWLSVLQCAATCLAAGKALALQHGSLGQGLVPTPAAVPTVAVWWGRGGSDWHPVVSQHGCHVVNRDSATIGVAYTTDLHVGGHQPPHIVQPASDRRQA